MKPETRKTVIRHLKGVISALEKEDEPQQLRYRGVLIAECTDENLIKAYQHLTSDNCALVPDYFKQVQRIEKELDKRSIVVQ